MELKTITLQTQSGNQDYVYNFGDIETVFGLPHRASVTEHYLMMVFKDRLTLRADARTRNNNDSAPLPDNNVVRRSRSQLKATLHSTMVWIPGNYFLVVRCDETGELCRFDFSLDECSTFHVTGSRDCERYGVEDMLSGKLFKFNSQALRLLLTRPGFGQFREWVIKRAQEDEFNEKRAELGKVQPMTPNRNMLVYSHGGVSRLGREAINAICDVVDMVEGDCATFIDRTCPNPYENLNSIFSERIRFGFDSLTESKNDYQIGMLFYNLWALNDGDGRLFMAKLDTCWPNKKYSVIFYGTRQEIDTLMEQNPTLRSHFLQHNCIEEEPPTAEELMQLFFIEADEAKLRFSPAAVDKVCRIIAEPGRSGITARWDVNDLHRYVHDTLQHNYSRHAVTDLQSGYGIKHSIEVIPEDIVPEAMLPHEVSIDGLFEELDALVGLDDIKRHIVTLANRVRFNSQRRQLGLPFEDSAVYHSVFTGNPGTGKTTVAKMMGKMLHTLGLLSKGDVIAVERSKMVGEYIGQTEQIMKRLLNEARGNVLFVDEAYTLYKADSDKDVGRIAIECLLTALSGKNPDMVVIFAGYKEKMDALFSMNDGLRGRFPYHFRFPDYNTDQLMQIAQLILAQGQYILTPDAEALLRQIISSEAQRHEEQFGNARWVDHLVSNGILPAMADRLMTAMHVYDKASYQTIQAIDVKQGRAKLESGTVMPSRTLIGFRA